MKYTPLALFLLGAACATAQRPAYSGTLLSPDEDSSAPSLDERLERGFHEYCFKITPKSTIGMRRITTTPAQFLADNSDVKAVINGQFFGPTYNPPHDEPEGIAYLHKSHQLAKGPHHAKAYFTVSLDGNKVKVSDSFDGDFAQHWLVIGTHPLLVKDNKVHPQATGFRKASRSAIGTKDGRNICFAVQEEDIDYYHWASQLVTRGYQGALNLDGGPFSQLAVRGQPSYAHGTGQTRTVIFEYQTRE